jgi:type IX secretion system PorP/SprF family membrane protein
MKKIIHGLFLLPILMLAALAVQAQDVPFYIHFFNNFYLQNPAMAGSAGYPVAYLTHHQQVIGDFADAPQHTSLSFNSPINKSRSSFGANIYNFKRGIMQNNGMYVSLAHRVDLGINHHLSMGFSAGFSMQNFNSSQLSSEDIETLQVMSRYGNKTYADGQFGLIYQIGYLQLGAVLPKLFNSVSPYGQTQVRELTPLKNRLFTASYSYYFSNDWMVQPFVIYRDFEYENKGFEFNGTVTYKDKFWVGGAYRQNYGAGLMFGMKAKDKISIGFGYKMTGKQQTNIANPAYEIQIGYHFGKKKQPKPVAPAVTPIYNPLKNPTIPTNPVDAETDKIIKSIKTMPQGNSDSPYELQTNIYVVVGSFRNQQYAQALTYKLNREDMDAKMGFNSNNQTYYVYILETKDRTEAIEKVKMTRSIVGFEKAWILKIVNEE